MNDNFGAVKARVRALQAQLSAEPGFLGSRIEFAQATSKAQRLLRDGDRTREPTPELVAAVERAESLARAVLRSA